MGTRGRARLTTILLLAIGCAALLLAMSVLTEQENRQTANIGPQSAQSTGAHGSPSPSHKPHPTPKPKTSASGTLLVYTDYLLWHSTGYTYEVKAFNSSGAVIGDQSKGLTTPAQSGSFP